MPRIAENSCMLYTYYINTHRSYGGSALFLGRSPVSVDNTSIYIYVYVYCSIAIMRMGLFHVTDSCIIFIHSQFSVRVYVID